MIEWLANIVNSLTLVDFCVIMILIVILIVACRNVD